MCLCSNSALSRASCPGAVFLTWLTKQEEQPCPWAQLGRNIPILFFVNSSRKINGIEGKSWVASELARWHFRLEFLDTGGGIPACHQQKRDWQLGWPGKEKAAAPCTPQPVQPSIYVLQIPPDRKLCSEDFIRKQNSCASFSTGSLIFPLPPRTLGPLSPWLQELCPVFLEGIPAEFITKDD